MKMEWEYEQESLGDGKSEQGLQTVVPMTDSFSGTKQLTNMTEICF